MAMLEAKIAQQNRVRECRWCQRPLGLLLGVRVSLVEIPIMAMHGHLIMSKCNDS